jgi:sulfite exporter TauE/SafE
MQSLNYSALFVLGFLGSAHCIGMCGPLQQFIRNTSSLNQFFYHYGRWFAYACVGLLFYLIGYSSQLLMFQKWLTVCAGSLIVAGVLFPNTFNFGKIPSVGKYVIKFSKQKQPFIKFFVMGLGNGFLPCGLVYLAAAQTLVSSDLWTPMFSMLAFTIGTLPALLGTQWIYMWLQKGKFYVEKVKPFVMIALGVLLIFRGLQLKDSTRQIQRHQVCVVGKL